MTVRSLFVLFIASVAVCNGALYAVEMAIARSSRFYARYETGMNMSLIAACQYLDVAARRRPAIARSPSASATST